MKYGKANFYIFEIIISQAQIFDQMVQKFFKKNSSVIRQKGESQNRCYKKTKHAKFSEKQKFHTPNPLTE